MKAVLLILLSLPAFADPTFKTISFYERGDKFRVETAKKWPKCQPKESARRIFHDKTNELREIAYWDEQGKMHEAGATNKPEVTKKVDEIFAATMSESENPCLTPTPPSKSSNAVAQ